MDDEIVKWVHYDNKIKEYNQKLKALRQEKERLSDTIFDHYRVHEIDSSTSLPTFSIPQLGTSLHVQKTNHYGSLTYTFLRDSLEAYFEAHPLPSETPSLTSEQIVEFIRERRDVESRVSIKRETLSGS